MRKHMVHIFFCRYYHLVSWGIPFVVACLPLINDHYGPAEVIKTIRDIISLNPLYKEFLAQLVEGGKRVADNPVHLADFGREAAGFY